MKITIYSSPNCPYCHGAKQLLDSKNLPYEDIDLSQNPDLRTELSERHQYFTVPMIFIDDEFIGGYSELQARESQL